MITNQVMKRSKGFIQRTKDGYFNATALLSKYNERNRGKKQIQNYKNNKSFSEFVEQLKSEGINKPMISGRGSGEKAGTWMHPKLFVDFAMWLSVEFKSIVIDYVLDGLIKSRHDAGDYYNEMTACIMEKHIELYNRKAPFHLYITEANMIKEMAGVEKDRNELTEKELNIITTMQKVNTELIKQNKGRATRRNQLETIAAALK